MCSMAGMGFPMQHPRGPWSHLEMLKKIEFDGLTGKVSFNQDGDRIMNYSLWNLQSIDEKSQWIQVSVLNSVYFFHL